MSHSESGILKTLARPRFFNWMQDVVGAKSFREKYTNDFIKASSNDKVLDIGCGTGEILEFLPESVEYTGCDISEKYISHARRKYGMKGSWFAIPVADLTAESNEKYDLVLANGVLHHLSDSEVIHLCQVAYSALRNGGRFVAYDCCLDKGCSKVAELIIRSDRGKAIRTSSGYLALVNSVFKISSVTVRRGMLRIPYQHSFIEGIKNEDSV